MAQFHLKRQISVTFSNHSDLGFSTGKKAFVDPKSLADIDYLGEAESEKISFFLESP